MWREVLYAVVAAAVLYAAVSVVLKVIGTPARRTEAADTEGESRTGSGRPRGPQ
jgi:hypothetical protein